MAGKIIIFEKKEPEVIYRNAVIIKVHDDEIFYDIRFLSGKIKVFVENVSGLSFVSGNYVAVLISGSEEQRVYKIIGKGRRIGELENIPIVRI